MPHSHAPNLMATVPELRADLAKARRDFNLNPADESQFQNLDVAADVRRRTGGKRRESAS
jgi:hypothetical protein